MSNSAGDDEQQGWGRLIRLSTRRRHPAERPEGRRSTMWERPDAAVRRMLSTLDARAEHFLASRHAANLPKPVAGFAARAVLAFQAGAVRAGGASWGNFDVSTFARWLGKRDDLHPAVVPDLFRAFKGVFSWLIVENEIDPITAQQIVEDLESREDEIVHGVIDRHLASRGVSSAQLN